LPAAEAADRTVRDFALAEAAAREAGALAVAHFYADPRVWEKGDKSPVSEADHAVDRLLFDRLTAFRPDYGWLSEESPDSPKRLTREEVWIVDPIDGTRSFLKQRDDWVVSIALARGGRSVLGVLYNPLKEEFFAAIEGRGATLNGAPLAVGKRPSLEGCRMLASPGRLAPERWRTPWPDMEVSRRNALAYRIALVAAGRFDATIAFARVHEWDIAAAGLILAEAGGRMTDFSGAPIRYNRPCPRTANLVAANPALHAAITGFVGENAM
jgi:myo-inositol-1(or 4)-monophosphatase